MYSKSRKMRGADFNRHGGGKPEGKEGVFSFPRETYSRFAHYENDVQLIRSVA